MVDADAGDQVRVVSASQARQFWEGVEDCHEYLRIGDMWFGTSALNPGETGARDPGHARSTEVFFCAQGKVLVDLETSRHELGPRSALVIPPGVPHTITNIGSAKALVVWAGAPGESV